MVEWGCQWRSDEEGSSRLSLVPLEMELIKGWDGGSGKRREWCGE